MTPSHRDTPYTNRSIIVPHAIINSGSVSQISEMEVFLTTKLRQNPDIVAKLITARDAKKKADTAQADAKRTYDNLKR